MIRTQRYTIDGQTYDSLEAMPPDVRREWDSLAKLATTLTEDGAAGALKPTTVQIVHRAMHRSGGSQSEATTYSSDTTAELSAGTKLEGAGPTRVDSRTRVLSIAVLLLLLPTLPLAVWGMLTSVRITMAFGPVWWLAAAALWAALTAGFARFSGSRAGGAGRAHPGKLLALILGMLSISTLAVLGGVPVLLHQLTARPGEVVVTVERKQTAGGRYSCSPRVIIAEFTFPLRNHLCTGRRAFSEIQVGSKIRLEGEVSDFGVTPDVFRWSKPK